MPMTVSERRLPACNGHESQDFFDSNPSRISPLVRVSGCLAARNFAPAFAAVRVLDPNQNNPSFVGAAKTGFKEMDEWKNDLDELD